MDPITVAIDVGPLPGHRTGVGSRGRRICNGAAPARRRRAVPVRRAASAPAPAPAATGCPLPAGIAHAAVGARRPTARRPLAPPASTSCTARTTSCRRAGSRRSCRCTTAGSSRHRASSIAAVDRAGSGAATGRRRGGASCTPARTRRPSIVRELLRTERVEVVHLGPLPRPAADARRPRSSGLDGRPFVLAVGTLERRKNLPPLVAAFGQLADTHRRQRARASPARDGDDSDRGRRRRRRRCPPPVATRDLHRPGRPTTPRAWLLHHARRCSPTRRSTRASASRCSTRMQLGTPIVASDAGSIPEVAGDAALLVDGDDPAAFAAAIEPSSRAAIRRLALHRSRAPQRRPRSRGTARRHELDALYRRASPSIVTAASDRST